MTIQITEDQAEVILTALNNDARRLLKQEQQARFNGTMKEAYKCLEIAGSRLKIIEYLNKQIDTK